MNNLAAQLVGLVATVLGICSLHFKTPHGLILCQTAGNLAFTVHYLMLGAYSASVGQILTILNAFVILWAKATGSQRKGWKWGFTILSLIACLASWKDNFSIFPCIGTVVIVLANWTFDSQIIRFNKLCITCPGWVIYDIHVGSWSGILCECIAMVSAFTAILRYRTDSSHGDEGTPQNEMSKKKRRTV